MSAKIPLTRPAPAFPDSSFKYTPLRHVRVLFIRFCQGLFFSAPPGCYHWEPDDERSEILITNENQLDPELINKRPGVHFTRGPCQFYSLGIDDRVSMDLRTDGKEKGVLVPGSMTVNVVSRVQQEAEDLAWVIAEHIWLLRDLLMKAGFFEIGRGPQIGAPSQAGSIVANDSGDEFYVTPVSIPWQFARNSKFTPLGRRIVSSIEQSLATTVTPIASQGWRYHPHEYPVQVSETQVPSFAPRASDSQGATPDPTGADQTFLPKQPHPLKAGVMVSVRTVRPFRQGLRLVLPGGAVPITGTSVEES